ncbi:hypothetical protein B0H13DRAFT_2043740 [Mycena leptocephala]|nr:hypothetical protein B0H13DRAFT_2043740 [Mycena leptocephala]
MVDLNEDVFSCILSHISDLKTLHAVLSALPNTHLLFPPAVARLWQLPVLDYLLNNEADRRPLAESVRHLRLPELFRQSVNLESLDYHSFPGMDMKSEHVEALQPLERLRVFAVDCALCSRDNDVPASGGDYAAPGELSAEYDAENWEIEPFLSTVGPKIISLDLRHVNQTMFTALKSRTDLFASYHALEHLKIDITEGVWDWGGGGSRPWFPSVKRFQLIVCDKTLSGSQQKGPLNLVHCHLLTALSIDVRYSIWWAPYDTIKLFEVLSPLDFPTLLGSRDDAQRWEHEGRTYSGLVPSFLGSMRTGSLPKLRSLWVDEKMLLPPGFSVQDLLEIDAVLGTAFERLESLRVGFDPITHVDSGLILNLCNPEKLTQFGFAWNWFEYGRDEPIAAELLANLSRFPKLTDVHIIFPRPETDLPGMPDTVVDARTLDDISSIFSNSVVWGRHPTEGPSAILLVSDGSMAPNPAVSKFYHAGYMPKYDAQADNSDNANPPRPVRGAEIEQLRDMLHKIMT